MSIARITHRLAYCFPNPTTETKLHFIAACKCNTIACESHFVPPFNQINATYSTKQPEGEMNQQDAYLICLKQEIYTKHQSEVIVLHDWRELPATAQ